MKRRLRRIVNFFAFNLLFFALYLNFIHKDKASGGIPEQTIHSTAAVTGTIPVSEPEKYTKPKAEETQATGTESTEGSNPSIN